jgi:hypothetical protein
VLHKAYASVSETARRRKLLPADRPFETLAEETAKDYRRASFCLIVQGAPPAAISNHQREESDGRERLVKEREWGRDRTGSA